MVTTIGFDPHKATHTAVAIDEFETVLGKEALRTLKRRLSNVIYRHLVADQQRQAQKS